jgi:hypothetical protein
MSIFFVSSHFLLALLLLLLLLTRTEQNRTEQSRAEQKQRIGVPRFACAISRGRTPSQSHLFAVSGCLQSRHHLSIAVARPRYFSHFGENFPQKQKRWL